LLIAAGSVLKIISLFEAIGLQPERRYCRGRQSDKICPLSWVTVYLHKTESCGPQ
jgi:hypothetical protein